MADRGRKAWTYFEEETIFARLQRKSKKDYYHSSVSDENLTQLLDLLGLETLYPRKISITSVTEINFDYLKEPRDWKEVPWWTLKKIISSDFSFREISLYEAKKPTQSFSIYDDEEIEDTDTYDYKVVKPHPGDVFCAIFLCCNDFLKEVLCRKMAKLQVALPLTFTISSRILFFRWPLERVFLAEECESVVRAEYPILLFLRLGNISFPKSRILNEILWKQKHETYFHKRPQNDVKYRTISKGCIETSWYIKDDEGDERFSENLTFLNLRGDVLTCESEMKLILPSCSIVVLFIEYNTIIDLDKHILSELESTEARLIVVTKFPEEIDRKEIKRTLRNFAEKTNKGKEMIDVLSVYDLENKNSLENAETGLRIVHILKTFLAREKKRKTLYGLSTTYPGVNLCVDENRLNQEAGGQISEFMSLPFSSFCKSGILPLQGSNLWQRYSYLLKDKKRLHKKSRDVYSDENSRTMARIREEQARLCKEIGKFDVMSKFVEILIQYENDSDNLLYFTSCIRHELDTISRQKYRKSKQVVGENSIDTAIGLEHFFREMGQCFEAFMHFREQDISSKTLCILNSMPKVLAKLLMLGIPLEIMDGDAGNIPLNWIKAVFKELKNELPDKKLLSLSVIGIQSSGKSTMLNAMFGVEFTVSCGRCTRGINMKLLPVHKSKDFSPKYDYIMLFDTEGLRSVEKRDNILHDNELATMVIGVADVVMINIKGETIAEMENVLQIVVYALLRVKQVYMHLNLKPKCIFLHQNAEKGDALEEQMLQITKDLDKVTQTIANRECITDVKAFKDVIDFDPKTNVKYISNLWLGRPPMAPVSESYSRDIINVGTHILQNMTTNIHHCLSVEDSMEKIENTWEAILAEDFVFSFRNTLEVKAYNSLDSQVKAILFGIENLKNRLGLEIDPALSRCNLSNINSVYSNLELKFETSLDEEKNNGIKRIQEFVEKSELKAHVINWKKSKEINITEKTETMKRELKTALDARIERKKLKLENNDDHIWQYMFDEALKLANDLKNKGISENEKLKKFDELWKTKVNILVPKTDDVAISKKHEKLWTNMTLKLNREFDDHTTLINTAIDEAICKHYSHGTFKHFFSTQFKIKDNDYKPNESFFRKLWSLAKSKEKKKIEMNDIERKAITAIFEICEEIDTELNKFTNNCEYDVTSFTPLLALARKCFKNINEARQENSKIFLLTPLCETKFASALSFFVYKRFCGFNEQYEKESSVRTWIESKKDTARRVFIDTIQKKEDLDIAVNELSQEIRELILKRIKKCIPLKMKEDAERVVSCKYQILVDYLVELAEKGNFNDYKDMLNNPCAASKKKFLEKAIETFKGSGASSPYRRYVEHEISRDIKELIKILDEMNNKNDITDWIKNLAQKMQRLEFRHAFENEFRRFAISDFKNFKTSLIEALEKTQNTLNQTLGTPQDAELELGKSNILKTFDEIWGCPELCPFCKEPCQFDKGHLGNQPHRCIQHRPNGLTGWRNSETHKLVVNHCNWLVNSSENAYCGEWCGCKVVDCKTAHPYQEYKDYIPDWDIPPLSDLSGSPYWSRMVVIFIDDLVNYHNTAKPEIPKDWELISKQEAIQSIRKFVPK